MSQKTEIFTLFAGITKDMRLAIGEHFYEPPVQGINFMLQGAQFYRCNCRLHCKRDVYGLQRTADCICCC